MGKFKTKKSNHCCNPFSVHKGWQIKNLRSINDSTVEKANDRNINLIVGQHICISCLNRVNKAQKSAAVQNVSSEQQMETAFEYPDSEISIPDESPSSDSEFVEFDVASIVNHLNNAIQSTGLQPIDKSKLRYKSYAIEKQNELVEFLSSHVFKVPTDSSEMIQQLQDKFKTATNRDEKIKILSILPQSWSASKVASTFKVPDYMATTTKQLVEANGILCGVKKKIGSRTLSDEVVKVVQEYYRSDEVSKICPGLRDYVTVTDDGQKITIQRRLVLMNLKEAYVKFKIDERYKEYKVGFSKFAELRPPECVLAFEKYGTHNSCVCQYHQNFKLLFSSLKKMGLSSFSYNCLIL